MLKPLCLAVAVIALPSFAGAKTPPPKQTHHCVKDGATIEKTKKECLKEGGKWEKNAPEAAKPAEPKPEEKPAPKPE
jgi:hypothetical protein